MDGSSKNMRREEKKMEKKVGKIRFLSTKQYLNQYFENINQYINNIDIMLISTETYQDFGDTLPILIYQQNIDSESVDTNSYRSI